MRPTLYLLHHSRLRVSSYEVCSKSIANFDLPRFTYIRFFWRYVGTDFLIYTDKYGHFECSVNFWQLLCLHVFRLNFDFWLFQKLYQRICIKFCVKNKIKCADAFRMLTVAYGEATLDRSNVYRWYKMFSEDRTDVDDENVSDARARQQQTKTLMKCRK